MTADPYRWAFDHVLTRIDAERAHSRAFGAWRAAARVPGVLPAARRVTRADPALAFRVFGREVSSPLGLAAGFDKNGTGIDALAAWGFGSVEIGTVTGHPQPGNPRPRLLRLPADRAIVNRMGFNNEGSAAVARRLAERAADPGRAEVLLGVNIGKTKAVPAEDAVEDYRLSASRLAPHADYLVVNVSSPNTPGLRDLQAVDTLRPLLTAVRGTAEEAAERHVPLLVKIAPDLADDDIRAVAALVEDVGLSGVVATNTTTSRDGLTSPADVVDAAGEGGLSGPVLAGRSMEVLRLLRGELDPARVVISVGGVGSAADVRARLDAGASLVQAYSAFVYDGPLWPRRVNAGLARLARTAPPTADLRNR